MQTQQHESPRARGGRQAGGALALAAPTRIVMMTSCVDQSLTSRYRVRPPPTPSSILFTHQPDGKVASAGTDTKATVPPGLA